MVKAYTKLELTDLAADAKRVLDLNREKGTFTEFAETPNDRSFARVAWDYMGLDKN
jgi:outer membrane protein assembly factor BamD